ncbi:MAG: biopolymer transporter ExbD [Deltaproteobacteria bacterium]|nr:biopolymer transporter ExbD [Deltaproteobacteria bacterium]
MAATMGARRRGGGMITAINVTPLCDILLVLLIIFMVASTYIVAQTLKVELPKSASSDGPSSAPLTLTLLRDDSIRWNGKEIDEPALKKELASAVAANAQAELIISADEKVEHGRVVHFIDLAKKADVSKFAINVEQSKK